MIIKDEIQFKVEVKVAPSYVTDNGGKVGGKVGGKNGGDNVPSLSPALSPVLSQVVTSLSQVGRRAS